MSLIEKGRKILVRQLHLQQLLFRRHLNIRFYNNPIQVFMKLVQQELYELIRVMLLIPLKHRIAVSDCSLQECGCENVTVIPAAFTSCMVPHVVQKFCEQNGHFVVL